MTKPTPPNILVFLTDDHGQWAANCYGQPELHTPTMNHLAATGARMTRAFTPSPVCSPARASFFTGKLPSQHGIHDWIHEHEDVGRAHPGLRGQTNIGQLLQEAGYQTAMIGKWHCGHSWEPHPGFDRWFSYGLSQYPHKGTIKFSDQGRVYEDTCYQSVAIADQAVDFLRTRDHSRPFFLFVGLVDTHTPFGGHPERLVQQYRDHATFNDVPNETFSSAHGHIRFAPAHDAEQRRADLAQYFAAIEFIDQQLGRVIDEIDVSGNLDDTLVVYTADHGHLNGHHGLSTKGNATVPQNFLEESIRVPALLSWKDHIKPARSYDAPVDHCDLFTTLLDAAGANPPADATLPGQSYLPLLRGDTYAWRDAWFGEYGNARCIRTERYKLIVRYPGDNGHFGDELYDLDEDPRERENRIHRARYSDTVRELRTRLEEHFDRYDDPKHSGRDMSTQPPCNQVSPWLLRIPGMKPPQA